MSIPTLSFVGVLTSRFSVIIGGITLSFPWLYICWTAEHPISAGRYEIAEQRVLEEGPTRVQSRASKMPEKR